MRNEVMAAVYRVFGGFRMEGRVVKANMSIDRVQGLKNKGIHFNLDGVRAGWFVCIAPSKSGTELWMVEGYNNGADIIPVNMYSLTYNYNTYMKAKEAHNLYTMGFNYKTHGQITRKRKSSKLNGLYGHLVKQMYRL